MLRHGTKPSKLDRRDLSFHRTFPRFAAAAAALSLLDYSLDAGLTMPDQNADGLPMGCTGYTQADCKTDQEKKIYLPSYTYLKTCFMEGHDTNEGCDIRTSAKALRVYGALCADDFEEADGISQADQDALAAKHKSGQTFSVDRVSGRDWFDSFRIALRAQRESAIPDAISIGTPWFPEWHAPLPAGRLTALFAYNGDPYSYGWHNYKICGEKTIDGEPHLQVKSWQGRYIGDHGWLYLGREAFNKAFDIYGTIGLTVAEASPDDVKTIRLDILQTVLSFLNRMLILIDKRAMVLHA